MRGSCPGWVGRALVWVLGTAVVAAHALDPNNLSVDGEALLRQIETLGRDMSDSAAPAVTRVLFTEHDMRARKYVKELMEVAGLAVREDSMGNIFGRLDGENTDAAPVMSGSHTDAIPLSGKYDGVVGVLGAIEALRALKQSGCTFERPLDALMFTSEEPTRFGLSCVGSRAMCGRLEPGFLDSLKDENGTTFTEAIHGAYGTSGTTAEVVKGARIERGKVHAFLELHIEQGPLLERAGLDIGVVTAIAAPASLVVDFKGNGGHAGALLMPDRRDAGVGAAELAVAVEQLALQTGSVDTVATTGVARIQPGAINSVPREAHLEIDVRDTMETRRDKVLNGIKSAATAIASRRGLDVRQEVINQDPPAPCAAQVVGAVQDAADALGLGSMQMVSRAYHDALFMAQICPTGMVFIPCRGGVSHRPDEFSTVEQMEKGVRTLAGALAELAGAKCSGGKEEL